MAVSIIMWLLEYHVGSLQEVYTGGPYTARQGMYGCQYYHVAVSIIMLEAYKKFILVALILQGKVCTAVCIIMRLLVFSCWNLTRSLYWWPLYCKTGMAVSIIMWLLVYHVGNLQEVFTGGPYTAR